MIPHSRGRIPLGGPRSKRAATQAEWRLAVGKGQPRTKGAGSQQVQQQKK